jgi:methylenetetrahydrofolate reductase (NADPH)
MLRGYSIEVNPSDSKTVDAALARLDPGTEVFLTWIPGADPMDLICPAERLRRRGLIPVPHIGARHLQSATQLERLAGRLAGEAGVDRILAIRRNRSHPAGPYDSSLAVMQSNAFQNAGIFRMAVAGFPEGNPNIPSGTLEEALAAKVAYARSAGVQLSVVTQFCFEPEPIVAWLRRICACGIDIPLRVGLAGPAGLLTLARYAVRCGIRQLGARADGKPSFARLLLKRSAHHSWHRHFGVGIQCPPFGITGLHFYVFGGFDKTVDWINGELSR